MRWRDAEQRLAVLAGRAANRLERASRRPLAGGAVHDARRESTVPSRSVSTISRPSASRGQRIRPMTRCGSEYALIMSRAAQAEHRSAARPAAHGRPRWPGDPRCSDRALCLRRCTPTRTCAALTIVPGGEPQPGARQQRWILLCLCHAGFHRWRRSSVTTTPHSALDSSGYELVEKRGLKRFQARTCLNFAVRVLPWTETCRNQPRPGVAGLRTGATAPAT